MQKVFIFIILNVNGFFLLLLNSCNGFNYTDSTTCNMFVLEKEKTSPQQSSSSNSIYMNVNKPDSELKFNLNGFFYEITILYKKQKAMF